MEMTRSSEPTGCETFRQHLKSCPRGSRCADTLWHGFDISDNPDMYMEERRKCDQARLARSLKKVNEVRLLRGYNPRTGYASEKQAGAEDVPNIKGKSVKKGGSSRKGGGDAKKPVRETLRMEKVDRIMKLSDVKLIYPKVELEPNGTPEKSKNPKVESKGTLEKSKNPKVETEGTLETSKNSKVETEGSLETSKKAVILEGTLETHVNGFLFTNYDSSFHVHCLFKDIKGSFFQLGNGSSPPLLHFHVVEEKITKDILVHLLMTPGSDKVGKEKHNEYEDRNRDLKIFIFDVEDKWTCTKEFTSLGPFQLFTENDVFHGYLSSMEKAVFTLTYFSIRVYVAASPASPFIVVDVEDIEIVNLAVLGHEMISMTVVPKNFEVESVFEFRFPAGSLTSVKDWLYRGGVKYYVNNKNKVENWKSLVEDIAKKFKTFLERGGWDQYGLEDNATIEDYYSMRSESESEASDTKWGASCSESDSEEDE